MSELREWLPIGAVSRPAVQTPLSVVVSDWSDFWFAKRNFRAARFSERAAPGSPTGQEDSWLVYRKEVAVRFSKAAMTKLLETALDTNLAEAEQSDADQYLLQAFGAKMVRDLILRLERALNISAELRDEPAKVRDPFGPDGGLEFCIADGQGPELLVLAIPLTVLMPLCRMALPPRSRRSAPVRMSQALRPTTVAIEAVIGEVTLAVQELGTLSPGDVVVLGAGLDQLAEIFLAGSNQVFARGRLTEVDSELALTLHAQP